jgi:hypothetical protein
MFLWNIRLSLNYTALQPTRQFSLILYGIRMNCLSSRGRLLLYLFTRMVLKLSVIILRHVTAIKLAQNFILLKVNFICQWNYWRSCIDLDLIGPLLLRFHVCAIYSTKLGVQWDSTSVIYIDFNKSTIHLWGKYCTVFSLSWYTHDIIWVNYNVFKWCLW